jgi:pimeloyl-ACP methyl ester carboxylesterase
MAAPIHVAFDARWRNTAHAMTGIHSGALNVSNIALVSGISVIATKSAMAALTTRLVEQHGIDPRRIHLRGYSGGARLASHLTVAMADRLSSACCVGGIRFVPSSGALPPLLAIHGGSIPSIPTTEAAGRDGLNLSNRWFTSGPSRPGADRRRTTSPFPTMSAKLATSTPEPSRPSASSPSRRQRTHGREHRTLITSLSSVLPGVSVPPKLIGISFATLINCGNYGRATPRRRIRR